MYVQFHKTVIFAVILHFWPTVYVYSKTKIYKQYTYYKYATFMKQMTINLCLEVMFSRITIPARQNNDLYIIGHHSEATFCTARIQATLWGATICEFHKLTGRSYKIPRRNKSHFHGCSKLNFWHPTPCSMPYEQSIQYLPPYTGSIKLASVTLNSSILTSVPCTTEESNKSIARYYLYIVETSLRKVLLCVCGYTYELWKISWMFVEVLLKVINEEQQSVHTVSSYSSHLKTTTEIDCIFNLTGKKRNHILNFWF